jgi:pentatricopeptide repeat protein
MLRSLVLAIGLTCFLATLTFAQKGGGGGNQPPAPNPAPNPSPNPRPNPLPPGQPNNNPTNPPGQTQDQVVSIRGRIVAEGVRDFPQLEVRIEMEGGQPLGFAYTNSSGEFSFQAPMTSSVSGQGVYVIFQMDGFKPFRERVGGLFDLNSFGTMMNIFLERDSKVHADKPGSAVVDIKQLRSRIPGKAVDDYEKALKESSKGNTAGAVEYLVRAVKTAPDFYEAQGSLGVQYLRLKKYDEAETALLHAKNLSPKAAEPLINLGMLYYDRGEVSTDAGKPEEAAVLYKKAADLLEESVKTSPLSASAQVFLGASLYKTGSYERAESTLKRALELDDQQQEAYLMLINVYVKESRFDEALTMIKSYLDKNPQSSQRPALESIQGKLEKAIQK